MADDPNKRGPQDRSRVNLSEDYEVRYWTKEFGVSEQELRDAVKKVGSSSQQLAQHFGSKQQRT
jgi:hypothetical protein